MDILSIIEKKKFKQELDEDEIRYFINGYAINKTIPDYQASALLMAITLNGLTLNETYYLTKAMLESGTTIDLSSVDGIKIDKHSTGGVGDKVSLILSPICAALGIKVAKLSGKGLGHTGGTIDKLESIGVNCNLNKQQYLKELKAVGMFIISQTEDIVPADKYIYNLRNATSTVQSFPLIAASIVSKKLALKTDYVFLDVKVGDGGFAKTLKDAIKLSDIMLKLFKQFKRKAVIHITNMTQPLGRAIGNIIEVKSSIDFLKGKPESIEIKQLIYDFVKDILITLKICSSSKEAYKRINEVINSNKALDKFYEWVGSQGANVNLLKKDEYFKPKYKKEIKATKSGYLNYLSTKTIGLTSFYLGAGRIRKEDPLDYQAGIYLNKIHGEYVKKGDVIGTLYSSKPIQDYSIEHFVKNVQITTNSLPKTKMIVKVMKSV